MPKRNLFEELKRSLQEVKDYKSGKITLRNYSLVKKPLPKIDPQLIRDTRERLHLSRAIFAAGLRVCLRTLEKWEQGATVPNDQAVALILMVRKYPDTFNRLAEIDEDLEEN